MATKQSATEYVKKGTVVNGKKVTRGYTAHKSEDGSKRRVKGKVEITEGGNLKGRLKGKAVGSLVNASHGRGNTGAKKGGGASGGVKKSGGGNGSNGVTPVNPPLTPAQKKAKKVAKVAKRVAKTTVKARKADTASRKTGSTKTTTFKDLEPPKIVTPRAKAGAGTEGPKGSDRQRKAANSQTSGKKAPTSGYMTWGSRSKSGTNNPFAALSFFKPGKNTGPVTNKSSSQRYNWSK